MVRAIFCPVEGKATVVDLTFAEMQKGVGGYIESLAIEPGLAIYCNEDALRLKLPANPHTPPLGYNARHGAIHGPFYVVRHDGEGEQISVMQADVVAWGAA